MTSWWRTWIPTKNDRELKRLSGRLQGIRGKAEHYQAMDDGQLQSQTGILKERFERAWQEIAGDRQLGAFDGSKEESKVYGQLLLQASQIILEDAFALVREASSRVLGLRHYDVQLLGGMVLHEGKIAEMKTGEGKTLVATLPAFLNALSGLGLYVVTVNEYLAQRDAAWMGKLYRFLGMDVGVILNGLSDSARKQAYQAPITYGTNSEFGFDYLRDNMKLFANDYVQRGMYFALVDEVDSILIDEARTPLIISGPAEESIQKYVFINQLLPGLCLDKDYILDEKNRSVVLTEQGIHTVEKRLNIQNLYDVDHIELLHHVNQGLRAHTLYRRDVDYLVEDNKVRIIDEFTGRVMEGRRWSDGLHQAIEAKEGVAIENENQTLASITYQNYFRQFMKVGGMTGTAETEAEEFAKIYDLDVVSIPTHHEVIRQDADDIIFKTEKAKFQAIVDAITQRQQQGQPVLVGTVSVEKSEILSRYLTKQQIPHHVLNAKYHRQEADIIAQAGRKGAVTIATNMAGRGTDILLGGNPEILAKAELAVEDGQAADPLVYEKTLQRFKQSCLQEKEEVMAVGGLHVLGTERHESRRIDNQLRGRSGRQGDPGSSRFYISLEDDLMRIFGGDKIKSWMETLGIDEVIEHPMVNRVIADAQKRVEGQNFDIRKHLLEYDDVMNDQRMAIYRLRRQVLFTTDIAASRDLVLDIMASVVSDLVEQACPEKTPVDSWKLLELQGFCEERLHIQVDLQHLADLSRELLEDTIYQGVEKLLEEKETTFGVEAFYHVSRILYLQTIDQLWKEHLREMDQLREGINLRSYAQKDPKQEYKKEGYQLFTNTMASIAADVAQRICWVVITSATEQEYQQKLSLQQKKQQELIERGKNHVGNDKIADAVLKISQASQSLAGPKARPNDLCHCGSGLKYKKCHMLQEKVT